MKFKPAILCCMLIAACALCISPATAAADKTKQPAPTAAAVPTAAQPSAAALAQAEELVKLLGMDQVMRRLSAEAVLPLVRQVMGSDPQFNPKDLDDMSRAWQETVWHDLQKELVSAAAKVYARHLTAAEVAQALAFFKSPLGRKLVATQPQITGESRQTAEDVVKDWLTRINADPKLREDFFARVAKKLPPELREKAGKP